MVKLGPFSKSIFLLTFEREMKCYVDKFVAPVLAALDKAKDELVEKLKNKLVEEMEINEKMKMNQIKLEEQNKIEVGKSVAAEAKVRELVEILETKDEVIKMLHDGTDRELG